MTIGEKIVKLRTKHNLSQEQLAENLYVSRQSVSKWEMNQALPQIDKIKQLCDLFSVSTDELLKDEFEIGCETTLNSGKNKYFGTDGFRGEANVTLTSMHAYRVGRFLGWYYKRQNHKPAIVIGKDTRRSSYMLEYSIVAGITASGADAYMLHVTTTPSVSYVTRTEEFDCGVMITASHNPYYDNGIKIINKYGEKLDDKTTLLIEAYIDNDLSALGISGEDLPLAKGDKLGCIIDYVAGRNRYIGYLISLASHSYKKLRIGLDCANGSGWMMAKSVFDALGAQTYVIGTSPDGVNINSGCGSTNISKLCALVKENHLDIGFAFDGDADRCIAVDENGNVVDGDGIMYVLANRLKDKDMLENNTVVATVMSNSGLFKALKEAGIECVTTAVGDRYVYEKMLDGNYSLGGEHSGHIILKKYATTGDGILTAIMVVEEICDKKLSLSVITKPFSLLPQHTKNIRVKDKSLTVNDRTVQEKLRRISDAIGEEGRIILRESGTEPVIRVMVEAKTDELCEKYISEMVETIEKGGFCID